MTLYVHMYGHKWSMGACILKTKVDIFHHPWFPLHILKQNLSNPKFTERATVASLFTLGML